MLSPKQPTGSLPSTGDKRPSSSSDDVPPFLKHPEGDDNVDTLEKKLMLPSENSKELHSTDQPKLEAGNVADKNFNDTADTKAEAVANGKIEDAADEKVDGAADGKGDAAVDGGVFTPALIVQLLLESPSDIGTSAGKGKLLNIENQVEDALAIARAFDLSVFSNPCRDLFSLKPTFQLDGLELDSAANIGSNNAADFELSIGTGNAKSFAEPFLLAFLL
ncbi:hypothetical protein CQW23_15471 [Capsicum baccatum]|uniref:Uncharacterized protein n=1 Tax=Capsicum baccatum TaxID=33114 RepID=A0A2G2WM33_CAPBA|nr:hypothetical protein CQW23_15471 [Capsicum baccatum]